VNVATSRLELLERHGRAYGDLRLAIAFSDGLEGDDAKRVTRKGWPNTPRLADAGHGAGLLRRGVNRNPAVVLAASDLVGIDIDGPEGAELLRKINPRPSVRQLPRTIAVATGKGWHLWYRRPEGLTGCAKIELGPEGLEIAKDGYLIAPPAIHSSGRVYRFAEGLAPWEIAPAVVTHEQLAPFLAYAKTSRAAEIASTGPISEGGRHRHLFRVGCAMRRVGAGEESIRAALIAENAQRCEPPKAEWLVRELARDIADRYQPTA
jgi:hypothetical protein